MSSNGGRRRSRIISVLVSSMAFAIALLGTSAPISASRAAFDEDPIVFVHGCPLPPFTNEDAQASINRMRDRFAAAGYPDTISIPSCSRSPAVRT